MPPVRPSDNGRFRPSPAPRSRRARRPAAGWGSFSLPAGACTRHRPTTPPPIPRWTWQQPAGACSPAGSVAPACSTRRGRYTRSRSTPRPGSITCATGGSRRRESFRLPRGRAESSAQRSLNRLACPAGGYNVCVAMTKSSIAGRFALALIAGALACRRGGLQEDGAVPSGFGATGTINPVGGSPGGSAGAAAGGAAGGSAGGAAGGSAGGSAVASDVRAVRGFIDASGVHAVVFATPGSSTITEMIGTPLGNAIDLGGNPIAKSTPWGYRRHDGP